MTATTAATTDSNVTYTAATVTPFPARPATTPTNPALAEFLNEQDALADIIDDLRTTGVNALDGWTLDEPASDFAVALLDSIA